MSKREGKFEEVVVPATPTKGGMDEKISNCDEAASSEDEQESVTPKVALKLEVTAGEAFELKKKLNDITLERTLAVVKELYHMHESDPNFSGETLNQMQDFLAIPPTSDTTDGNDLLRLMKLEVLLSTENSPYAEVRANVDPTDDPSVPCSTLRAWFMGILLASLGCAIDTLFAFRLPGISISSNVAQLVAYPLGCFFARTLPNRSLTVRGQKFELNPGPFSQKEHMLITIMAKISYTAPYTFYIIPVQAMPQYFNMPFAKDRGYQVCISLAVSLFGLGLAGVLRRFLVYPSYAIWQECLPMIALIKAFHTETNEPVPGPFNRIYTWSRERIFLWVTLLMAVYFMLPGFLFGAMSVFSWMTWIAPNNVSLTAACGILGGVALNPWPTFDWNMSGIFGTYQPTFVIANQVVGIVIAALMSLAIWYRNGWETGHLPINSNRVFDNTGTRYNVTKVLDSRNLFDEALYKVYSQPWFSAGYIVYNIWCFASYTAVLSYVFIFHRHTIMRGFRGIYRQAFHKVDDPYIEEDIHYRLMKSYREVPDWHYVVLLTLPFAFGIAALKVWPTGVGVSALFYGLIMPAVFILPTGIVQATTSIPIATNVLAAIVGGAINAGDANGLIYFKCWAYLSSYQALGFVEDQKMAHYLKLPPRVTFWAQLVANIILALVPALMYNFIMGIRDVCTPDAPFKLICPSQTSFFTTTIFWGVISPKKLFGNGQRYNMMLLGFPLGVGLVLAYWGLRKMYPRSKILRQIHPVMLCIGPVSHGPPQNLAYYLGNLYVNLLSFVYLRRRYFAFWSKWNYVVSAALSCGLAIAALFIFFALQIADSGKIAVNWWGNSVVYEGCEGQGGCPRLEIGESGIFGPSKWS